MAITYVEGTVSGPTGKQTTVEFLVDSGAKYTLLPFKNWKAIGLKPVRRLTFVLADGTKVKRDMSVTSTCPKAKPTRRLFWEGLETRPCWAWSRWKNLVWFSIRSNARCNRRG